MSQHKVILRIEEICKEFDDRVEVVGVAIARLELAKALAESESAQHSVQSDGLTVAALDNLSKKIKKVVGKIEARTARR